MFTDDRDLSDLSMPSTRSQHLPLSPNWGFLLVPAGTTVQSFKPSIRRHATGVRSFIEPDQFIIVQVVVIIVIGIGQTSALERMALLRVASMIGGGLGKLGGL